MDAALRENEAIPPQEGMALCQKVMFRTLFEKDGEEIMTFVRHLVVDGKSDDPSLATRTLAALKLPEDLDAAVTLTTLFRHAEGRPSVQLDGQRQKLWALVLQGGTGGDIPWNSILELQEVIASSPPGDMLEACLKLLAKVNAGSVVSLYQLASKENLIGTYHGAITAGQYPLTDLLSILERLHDGDSLLRLSGAEVRSADRRLAEERLISLEAELSEVRQQSSGLIRERDSAIASRNATVTERDRARTEKDRAVAEKTRIAAERDRVSAERDRVSAERDRVSAERDRALADLGDIRLELETAKKRSLDPAELEKVNKDRDQLRRSVTDAQAKLKTANDVALKRTQAEKKERERQLRVEEQRVAEKKRSEADAAIMRVQLQDAHQDRETLRAEVARLTAVVDGLETRLFALTSENTVLKASAPRRAPPAPPLKLAEPAPGPVKQDDDFKAFFKYIAKHPVPA